MRLNPDNHHETLIDLFDKGRDGEERLICWGGYNMTARRPFIVFTPPHGIPRYSVKQEQFYKTFLLAAHIHFGTTGELDYAPEKAYDCYSVVFPREQYPFGSTQELPQFGTLG